MNPPKYQESNYDIKIHNIFLDPIPSTFITSAFLHVYRLFIKIKNYRRYLQSIHLKTCCVFLFILQICVVAEMGCHAVTDNTYTMMNSSLPPQKHFLIDITVTSSWARWRLNRVSMACSTVFSGCRSKKISKLCVTGLCGGNSPATGDYP